jgi:hypothetical protein
VTPGIPTNALPKVEAKPMLGKRKRLFRGKRYGIIEGIQWMMALLKNLHDESRISVCQFSIFDRTACNVLSTKYYTVVYFVISVP